MSWNKCNTWQTSNENVLNQFLRVPARNRRLPNYWDCCKYSPDCDTLIETAPAPYYTPTAVRFNTIPNGHIQESLNAKEGGFFGTATGTDEHDSNYIGPGTNEIAMIRDGYPPMSLSDTCALLHDIMYSLSRNRDDNVSADNTLDTNLRFVFTHHGEHINNISIAAAIAETGAAVGYTAGDEGYTLSQMKGKPASDHGSWQYNRTMYERILASLKNGMPSMRFGFLEEFMTFDNYHREWRFNLETL